MGCGTVRAEDVSQLQPEPESQIEPQSQSNSAEDDLRKAVTGGNVTKVKDILSNSKSIFVNAAIGDALDNDQGPCLIALLRHHRDSTEIQSAAIESASKGRLSCMKELLPLLKHVPASNENDSKDSKDAPGGALCTLDLKEVTEAAFRGGDVATAELVFKALLDVDQTSKLSALLLEGLSSDKIQNEAVSSLLVPRILADALGTTKYPPSADDLEFQLREPLAAIGSALCDEAHFAQESAQYAEDVPVIHFGKEKLKPAEASGCGTLAKYFLLQKPDSISSLDVLQGSLKSFTKKLFEKAVKARLAWATHRKSDDAIVRYALFVVANAHMSNGGCLEDTPLTDSSDLEALVETYKKTLLLPDQWALAALLTSGLSNTFQANLPGLLFAGGSFVVRKSMNAGTPHFEWLRSVMKQSHVKTKTRDRKGEVPDKIELVSALEILNCGNWSEYVRRRQRIATEMEAIDDNWDGTLKTEGPDLTDSAAVPLIVEANEKWLWHGTSHQGAYGITSGDFQLNKSGTGAGTLYGRGLYFAESVTKSDEYAQANVAGLRPVILCRVTLGRIHYTAEERPDTSKLEAACKEGAGYHSVLGDREAARGTFKEFIVYDDDQAYPAYLCYYRRVEESGQPERLSQVAVPEFF